MLSLEINYVFKVLRGIFYHVCACVCLHILLGLLTLLCLFLWFCICIVFLCSCLRYVYAGAECLPNVLVYVFVSTLFCFFSFAGWRRSVEFIVRIASHFL